MYKTLVMFRGEPFGSEIWIDSKITTLWPTDLPDCEAVANASDGALTTQQVWNMHAPEEVQAFCQALQGMQLRVRFNTDIAGPYVFNHSEKELDDELLITYFKQNYRKATGRLTKV